jgi:hypothetical protein
MPMPNPTARELLVYVAGEDHAYHSVVSRKKAAKAIIEFRCSCGSKCQVAATLENLAALRNIPEIA